MGTHILETASGGTSQDTERIPPSEGHSLTGDGIERDESEHRKNPTERGALTFWRRHREGQVRIQRHSHRARRTHILEMESGGTRQETQKESHRERGTHILETASGETRQDTETIPPREGHSHPGDDIGRDRSGHKTIPPSEGHSHAGDGIGRNRSGYKKNPTERWPLTSWRRYCEGQVRTQKDSHRATGTHFLETASGGTSQDTETIPPSEGHSHAGDGIRRNRLAHRNNPTERGALTIWR